MAVLDEEIRRKKVAASLLENNNGEGQDDTADGGASTDPNNDPDPDDSVDTSEEPTSKEPVIYAPATKKSPSYVLVPADQVDKQQTTSGHIELAPPGEMKLPAAA